VSVFPQEELSQKLNDFLQREVPNDLNQGPVILCITCRSNFKAGQVLQLCATNGLRFPDIPAHLPQLAALKGRLVSLKTPFMIQLLGYKQFGVTGRVVNVRINGDNDFCHCKSTRGDP
jgi:hypothetical protein